MPKESGTDMRLLRLKRYMLNRGLYKEAYALGRIVMTSKEAVTTSFLKKNADESNATVNLSGDETVAMGNRVWRSLSEPHLEKAGLKPIRFIAGTESDKRGEGKPSKEGNVYEVLYNGDVAVAKVLSGFDPAEPEVWKKIVEVKKTLSEDEARHLPDIYDIIKTDKYTSVIIMELLQPPNAHIRRILRTQEGRSREHVLRNEEFLSEALNSAFSSLEDFRPDPENKIDSEIYAMFEAEYPAIRQSVEGSLIKKDILPENLSKRVQNFAASYINMFDLGTSSLTKEIADDIQDRFIRHVDTSSKPVAKYFSPKGIDHTLSHIYDPNTPQSPIGRGAQKKIDILNDERSNSVYSENPESFLYSEKYMPETKGFFSMLGKLKDKGIAWSDVHANNIMERPGTRELVLIDVGLFD